MTILKLIRYHNLLMLAFMQLVFRYGFLKFQNFQLALTDFNYFLLIFSTLLLAAAGYVVNAIFDQDTDAANAHKTVLVGKKITESSAYSLYVGLNISGVALGFYLSNCIGKPGLASLFILIASLLYFYATTLKKMPLLGNLVVAFLLAFSVLIIGFFDLFPIINSENKSLIGNVFSILLDYAILVFCVNLIRELIKDLEDLAGDSSQGMRTLPIVFGISKTTKLATVLCLVPVGYILWYCNSYFMSNGMYLVTVYALATVVAPLLYVASNCWSAKTQAQFAHLSWVLKMSLFFGIISIALITFNMQHHA